MRIDTHHHLYPPRYVAAQAERILGVSSGFPDSIILEWTPERSLDVLGAAGIDAAVVSISAPGIWFGDNPAARRLARECNEYGARMVQDHRGRFGMFAALPLPDIEGSLAEIAYALDVLKLDGIGLMTSYDTRWPGDPSFAPVFDELERRGAVVYLHPVAGERFTNLLPNVPPPIIEFPFDTTRAVVSLLYGGTLARCPHIKFIVSHGGGTVPFLADRIASLWRRTPALKACAPSGVEHELRKIYYDVVSIAGNPHGMKALMSLLPSSQLLLGSDYPYLQPAQTVEAVARLGLPDDTRDAIEHANAGALFSRFAA